MTTTIPQAVVEEVQSHYLREENEVIIREKTVEKVTFSNIEQYVATELNFRLKDFDPDLKVNELERIQEKLDRALDDDEVKIISANYKAAGQEYSAGIGKRFTTKQIKKEHDFGAGRESGLYIFDRMTGI